MVMLRFNPGNKTTLYKQKKREKFCTCSTEISDIKEQKNETKTKQKTNPCSAFFICDRYRYQRHFFKTILGKEALINHIYEEQSGAEQALSAAVELTQSLPELPLPWQHTRAQPRGQQHLPSATKVGHSTRFVPRAEHSCLGTAGNQRRRSGEQRKAHGCWER